MYCNHCGKPNEDGTKICTSCGLEIQRTEDAVLPRPQPSKTTASKVNLNDIGDKVSAAASKIDTDKIKEKLDGMDKKKLATYGGIAGGALAVIIAVVVIVSSFTAKISLDKYIVDELTYNGINGYGSVDSDIELVDWEALQNDIMKKKIKQSDYDDYYYLGSNNIRDYISYECTSENNGTLSNGDDVEFTFTVNKEGIKENKMFAKKISGGEEQKFKFKVEGLTEGTAIDVFDAVECVTIDTTSYNRTEIKLKDNYVKQYENDGINVKTEDNYIRVYGDSFQSFTVYVHTVSDNFDETSSTVKLGVNCDADQYKDYGIVLAQTEADVNVNIISYVRQNTIPADDLAKLTKKVNDTAKDRLDGAAYSMVKAILYYDTDKNDNCLAYYVKSGNDIYMVYYNYLKQYSDGRIVDIDDVNPQTFMTFFSYKSIAEAEKNDMSFTEKVDVPLS